MTKPIARDPIYRRRRFEAEIIESCVRWYITYRLSYRDLVAMMAERGLPVSHTTILRWVIRYVPEFEKRWGRWARSVHSSWRVDETYISRAGKVALPLPRRRQARQDRRLSAPTRSRHCGGPGILPQGIGHHPCLGGRERSRSTGTPRVIRRCVSCAGRIRCGSMFSSGSVPTSTTLSSRIIARSNVAALPCWASSRSAMQR